MRGTSLPRKVNRLTECRSGYGALAYACIRIYNKVDIVGQCPMNVMVRNKPQNSLICKVIPVNVAIRFAKICSPRYLFRTA